MTATYNTKARKRPANLSVNEELLAFAKREKINLSRLLESQLEEKYREAKKEEWLRNNRGAMDAYNRRIEGEGLFGDGERLF